MSNLVKNILIGLALLAFLTVGTILIAQIGNINKTGASVSVGANGCPKDSNKWTLNSSTNECELYLSPSLSCESQYKYNSGLGKCYRAAARANNNYICNSGETKVTNNKFLGNGTYCIKDRTVKTCTVGKGLPTNATSKLVNGKCKVTVPVKLVKYTVTYNSNGGKPTADNMSKTVYKNSTTYVYVNEAVYGKDYKVSSNLYQKEGYVFTGWNEKSNGTGKNWTNSIGKNTKWTTEKNITLYAQWKKALVTDSEFNKCVITSYNKEKGAKIATTDQLTASQLASLKTLTCNNSKVTDIYGITKMTGLTTLTLSSNNLYKNVSKNPDLTKNTKLKNLTIGYAKYITELNLSKNTALQKLSISNSDIEKITGMENLKKLYSVTFYNLKNLGYNDSSRSVGLEYVKFLTIHRTPYIQGTTGVSYDGIDGYEALKDYALGNYKEKKEHDVFDVYQMSASLSGKTAKIIYGVNSKATGAKIVKVEYNKGNSWSGLSKENVTYGEKQTIVTFTKPQTKSVSLRVTTSDGVTRVFKNYNIKITG